MQLDQLDHIPAELQHLSIRGIRELFPNPTLIHLHGDRPEPLFVSTLLHGNETSSFDVLRHLQANYATHRPPRSLLIFIGNVEAAELGKRFLDDQPDFNRIWAHGRSDHHELAREVLSIARHREIFACIDIHNNSGGNPLYGCVSTMRPADLQMAAHFAPRGVYYRNPPTTLSIAFSALCPSITIECGRSGEPAGIEAAIDLVEHVLQLEQFDSHPPAIETLSLYETIGRVIVRPQLSIGFGDEQADITFPADLEKRNFSELPAGSDWARTHAANALQIFDEHGAEITGQFLDYRDGRLIMTTAIVPAMLTHDRHVIAQDCLCYFMRRVN